MSRAHLLVLLALSCAPLTSAAKPIMRVEVGAAVGGSMETGGDKTHEIEGGGIIAASLDFDDGPGLGLGFKLGLAGAGDTDDQFFWMSNEMGLLARYTVALGQLGISGYVVGGASLLSLKPEFVLTTDRITDLGLYGEAGVDATLPITQRLSLMVALHHSVRSYGEVSGSVTPLLTSGAVSVTVEDFSVQHTMATGGLAVRW